MTLEDMESFFKLSVKVNNEVVDLRNALTKAVKDYEFLKEATSAEPNQTTH